MLNLYEELEELKARVAITEEKLNALLSLNSANNKPKVYSVKEVAKILGKSPYTVSEWCRSGKLKATRNGTCGMYLIRIEAIEEFTKR